jgi:hypothetical protein
MHDPAPLSPVELLILTRLLPVGEKGETTAKIQKDLEPLLGHRWSGAVLTAVLDRALIKLGSISLVTSPSVPVNAKGKRKAKPPEPKYLLTPTGREQGLQQLGVQSLAPKTTWAVVKKIHLPAIAIGLTSPNAAALKSIGSDPGFKAALLKSLFQLPFDGCPTQAQAIDALSWKLLGVESIEKFSVGAVQKVLFHRALGEPAARPVDAKKAVDLLLAHRIGARRNDAKEFREALLRSWIDQALDGLGRAHRHSSSRPDDHAPPAPPIDLLHFAGRVLAAARGCPTGRHGDSKVFIVHVWRTLQDEPEFREMGYLTFKQRLAEANNARLLDLSRADLVQAMDPDDVRLSEVAYLNATFHFIRIEPESA